jgi:hypothetical protein
MGLFGGKEIPKGSVDEAAGVIIGESTLMRMLQPQFRQKITNVTVDMHQVDGGSFTIHFDDSGPINASVMSEEEMINFFKKYYARTVIEVAPFEGGHEQYLIRFEE